jgi:S1-C subfamily serine protease
MRPDGGGGAGTVILSYPEKGTFILTAAHVLREVEGDCIRVDLFEYDDVGQVMGTVSVEGCVVDLDAGEDLAAIHIDYQPSAVVAPLYQGSVRLFQDVYLVGCPMLINPVATKGHITALSVEGPEYRPYVGMSADAFPGNSGGGMMVEKDGVWYLAGVMGWGRVHGQFITYLGYCSPPERLRAFLEWKI